MCATITADAGSGDQFFAMVAMELSIGRRDDTLWTDAFALESGNAGKAVARYIRLRVEQRRQQTAKSGKIPASCNQHQIFATAVLSPLRQVEVTSKQPLTGTLHVNKEYSESLRQNKQSKSVRKRIGTRKALAPNSRHFPSIVLLKTWLRRVRPPKAPVIVHTTSPAISSVPTTSLAPDTYKLTPEHAKAALNKYI